MSSFRGRPFRYETAVGEFKARTMTAMAAMDRRMATIYGRTLPTRRGTQLRLLHCNGNNGWKDSADKERNATASATVLVM